MTMSVVETLYVQPKSESRALKRIRLLSLPFEIAFGGLALMQVALLVLFVAIFLLDRDAVRVFSTGVLVSTNPADWPPGSVAVRDLPILSQVYGAFVLSALMGAGIAAFVCLARLFDDYRRGIVFARSTMAWMRRASVFLVFSGVAPAVLQPATQALGLKDHNWLNAHNVTSLLVGAALFVLAYVIELGREIETEGKGYV
jgi:hypothetical protein